MVFVLLGSTQISNRHRMEAPHIWEGKPSVALYSLFPALPSTGNQHFFDFLYDLTQTELVPLCFISLNAITSTSTMLNQISGSYFFYD